MATAQELLQRLEERFILGEISEETYKQLKAKLLARLGGQEAGGGISIAEGAVAKIENVEIGGKKTYVGGVVINVGKAQSGSPTHPGLLVCPICGRKNKPVDVFTCKRCGLANLCLDHMLSHGDRVCCEDLDILERDLNELNREELVRYCQALADQEERRARSRR